MHDDLIASLARIAQTPHLLVACDYDGTLAELTPEPAAALPATAAVHALRVLGAAPSTTTAIVSGRALADLVVFLDGRGPDIWVGSHGAEWNHPGVSLAPSGRERLRLIAAAVESIVAAGPSLKCERKPAGVALHFRGAKPSIARAAVTRALDHCGAMPGVHVRRGNEVIEFMVVPADKGEAVARARRFSGATAAIFIGDDFSDEDAFRSLLEGDVAIKVGPGETEAQFRVRDVGEVTAVLQQLAWSRQRSAWERPHAEAAALRRGDGEPA